MQEPSADLHKKSASEIELGSPSVIFSNNPELRDMATGRRLLPARRPKRSKGRLTTPPVNGLSTDASRNGHKPLTAVKLSSGPYTIAGNQICSVRINPDGK